MPGGYLTISAHPLRNLSDYNDQTFLTHVDTLLSDPRSVFSAPVEDLTGYSGSYHNLNQHISTACEAQKASNIEYLGDVASSFGSTKGLITVAAKHLGKRISHSRKHNGALKLIHEFVVSRPALAFDDKERQIFRGAAELVAAGVYNGEQWRRLLAILVWNNGNCQLEPTDEAQGNARVLEIKNLLTQFLMKELPATTTVLAQTARDISAHRAMASAAQTVQTGARWMTPADVEASRYYSDVVSPDALVLGYHPISGKPLTFTGNESLISIGGPGSGKSQTQVIPNLLTYRGSAIILDVKGELWDATAGYREKHFGPVYKFAPTDPDGRTHRYNPFDFISKKPGEAANDCTVFTYQVVEHNPDLTQPYWENRGRDMMWAYAMMVALKASPQNRTIQGLGELLATPPAKDPNAEIMQLVRMMKRVAELTNISDLAAAADAIQTGINSKDRLESILDTARRYLALFNRNPDLSAAMSTSDWRPQIFRSQPGASLFITIPTTDLEAFGPIVRTMLFQHFRIFMATQSRPGELPITFFLDEMPQLGNFNSILQLQDVGRGSGLRLWMFCQSLGQLAKAFGQNRYEGVVDACRARCFFQPDNQAVRMIEPSLGETQHLFHGTKEPLARANDLMGKAFDDKIIVTTRGDHPVALDKRWAWKEMQHLMLPPPQLKSIKTV
ncbi:type IV secretory system conjugative DNA transfer family protein [Hyphomicrobium sp. B1]|uniref:type IV secretory system conjugative DNA transfer family protein n=1 Tax=unclassified Hyphomicrobium TaxID=2619925 RepID=UPI00391D71D9